VTKKGVRSIAPLVRRDPHALERLAVHDRRDQQLAIVLERNEPAIEEMINRGREQQAVLAVEALVVGLTVPPGLAVAGDQVFRPIDPRDPADVRDTRSRTPLPVPG